jgi:transcriptional regulator with XRE-family HTH domain
MRYRKKKNFLDIIGRRGLSQKELSRRAGISVYTLIRTERHRPATAGKVAVAFAAATGMDPEAAVDLLFDRIDDPKDSPVYAAA